MRWSDIAKRLNGISLPFGGIQWAASELEIDVARRTLALLEDRRVFFVTASLESPDQCVASVVEIRKALSEEIGKLRSDSLLKANLRGIRAACRAFLDKLGPVDSERSRWMLRDTWGRAQFGVALGELRATCGVHIAIIASTHKLSVDRELAETLPPKVLDRDI